jgi:hypothetical protein
MYDLVNWESHPKYVNWKLVYDTSNKKLYETSKVKKLWLVGGFNLPLWKMMEFVSRDDDIPNWMESHKIHVPNHQPDDITESTKRDMRRIWQRQVFPAQVL